MADGLKQLRDKYEKMLANVPKMMESAANEAAGEILSRTIKRTHVGSYPNETGKKGGTLRRSWTAGKPQKHGSLYSVTISNNTEYASYVEYGHRQTPGRYVPAIGKKLVRNWAPGQFMLTKSIMEVKPLVPYIVLKHLDELLSGK